MTEPTYMNSIVNYISPWILKYSDTVWANAEDCVVGIGPAPDYRESHTNAREFMVFQSLGPSVAARRTPCTTSTSSTSTTREGFPNHAAMAFGRGRFFLSTYLNPKLMSDDDWRIYAGLLRWARGTPTSCATRSWFRPAWNWASPTSTRIGSGRAAILAVRNPSNENQAAASSTWAGRRAERTGGRGLLHAVSLSPGNRRGTRPRTSQVGRQLAPWETAVSWRSWPSPNCGRPLLWAQWYRDAGGPRR